MARSMIRQAIVAWALLVACSDDDGSNHDCPVPATTARTTTASSSTTSSSTSNGTRGTSTSGNGSSTSATAATTLATTGRTSACPPVGGDTDSNAETGDMGFVFRETPYCDYVQIDRVGVPLISTLLITSKDDYNAAGPEDDISLAFFGEISSSLMVLLEALEAAIIGGGWIACGVGSCQIQTTPLVIPDVLELDPADSGGFPNGRRLDDPAGGRVLAHLLLDLGMHDLDAFADLLPAQNDVAFPGQWPYVAPPH